MSDRTKLILLRLLIFVSIVGVIWLCGYTGYRIGMFGLDEHKPWYVFFVLGIGAAILYGFVIAMIVTLFTAWIIPLVKWILAIDEN